MSDITRAELNAISREVEGLAKELKQLSHYVPIEKLRIEAIRTRLEVLATKLSPRKSHLMIVKDDECI